MILVGNNINQHPLVQTCPHCDPNSFALKYPLKITKNFRIVCDVHPLTIGRILIIPKAHLSCIGAYPADIYDEFIRLFDETTRFVKTTYGSVSTFEHGNIGQTVFHSHVQIFPYCGDPTEIIPEGNAYFTSIYHLKILKEVFTDNGNYLYFSINENKWLVKTEFGIPGFFRYRFARALGNDKRGNWKSMRLNEQLMQEAEHDITNLMIHWKSLHK